MTRRPPRVCTRCRQTVPAGQPCPTCAPQLEREADARRGSAHARGYNRLHRGRFRVAVLRRDPVCTCNTACRESGVVVHEPGDCDQVSTVADHWPLTKKELRERGLDEHDPEYGRGLCKPCHDRHTARTSPGGWHR